MKRFLALIALLMSVSLAYAQAPTAICFTTNGTNCVPVTPTNPFPVLATATIGGFLPSGSFATLTATGSTSASTALPTGTSVRVTNNGTTAISCTFATGAATGLASNIVIQAGSSVSRVVGTFDHIACIDQSGSASNPVILEGGSGLGNDSGGGGSGGGGGAITIASGAVASGAYSSGSVASGAFASGSISSGAMVDLGTQADGIYSGSGNATLISINKGLYAAFTGAQSAGSNTVGGVVLVPIGTSTNNTGAVVLTKVSCGSAVSSCVLKNAAGNFYGVYAECTSACWLMVFNSPSAPSNGATTAGISSGNLVDCVDIAANSSKSLTYSTFPINLSVGITAVISSSACSSLTLSTVGFISGTVM